MPIAEFQGISSNTQTTKIFHYIFSCICYILIYYHEKFRFFFDGAEIPSIPEKPIKSLGCAEDIKSTMAAAERGLQMALDQGRVRRGPVLLGLISSGWVA